MPAKTPSLRGVCVICAEGQAARDGVLAVCGPGVVVGWPSLFPRHVAFVPVKGTVMRRRWGSAASAEAAFAPPCAFGFARPRVLPFRAVDSSVL